MNLTIESYDFGKMTVSGKEFTSDLILYPNGRIQDYWWRKQGHNLILDDIADLIDTSPDILVIGTGANGMMDVSENLRKVCNKRGIDVEACPTAEAVTRFNQAVESGKKVAACFHLTC